MRRVLALLLLALTTGCPDFGSDAEAFCALNAGHFGCPADDAGTPDPPQ